MKNSLNIGVLAVVALICAGGGIWMTSAGLPSSKPAYDVGLVKQSEIQIPALPDISGYTTQAVQSMIPVVKAGHVEVKEMKSSVYFDYQSLNSITDNFKGWQETDSPASIELDHGVYDLALLAETLKNSKAIEKTSNGWTIRLPIVIRKDATLVISGADNAVRLSTEQGAYISNFGHLYIVNTSVTGWLEERNEPSVFSNSEKFRPYIASWSGSKTWLASSKFASLGYAFPKAYGLSFSSSAPLLREKPQTPRVTGWVVDCEFTDFYYGFYSYEADDIAIVNNVYKDNIIYGIDPHDRSERLIIAGNKASGTKKKHGIIISREVNNSWIFNNHSFDNHGSGIMIDRNSRGNVVAHNVIENNQTDGLVFIESPDNFSVNNTISRNGKNGVRIRNSLNIVFRGDKILNNGMYGVIAYAASLENQEYRDTKIDPYEQRVSFDMSGAEMNGNKQAHFNLSNIESFRIGSIRVFNAPDIFRGDMEDYEAVLFDMASTNGMQVSVSMKNKASPVAVPQESREENDGVDASSVEQSAADVPAGTELADNQKD